MNQRVGGRRPRDHNHDGPHSAYVCGTGPYLNLGVSRLHEANLESTMMASSTIDDIRLAQGSASTSTLETGDTKTAVRHDETPIGNLNDSIPLHSYPRRQTTVDLERGTTSTNENVDTGDNSSVPSFSGLPVAPQPRSLPVKITAWRLLNSAIIFTFGLVKAVFAYCGYSTTPTTLDWVVGITWALISYWVSLLEMEHDQFARWFLQDDLYSSGALYDLVCGFLCLVVVLAFCIALNHINHLSVKFLEGAWPRVTLPAEIAAVMCIYLVSIVLLFCFSKLLLMSLSFLFVPLQRLLNQSRSQLACFDHSDWSGGGPYIRWVCFIVTLIMVTILSINGLFSKGVTLSGFVATASALSSVCLSYFIVGLFRMAKRLWSRPG